MITQGITEIHKRVAELLHELADRIATDPRCNAYLECEHLFNYCPDESGLFMRPGIIYGTKYKISFTLPTSIMEEMKKSLERPDRVRNW